MGARPKATHKQIELFNSLVVNRFNRNGHIYSTPDRLILSYEGEGNKYLTSKGYAYNSKIERHLNGQEIIGLNCARKGADRFSSIILYDIDHPEQQTKHFLDKHNSYLGSDPSFTLVNPLNNHIYGMDMLSSTMPIQDIIDFKNILNDGLHTPIEVYPQSNRMVRLPFGYPYELVSNTTLSKYVAFGDYGKQVEIAYHLYESGQAPTIDTKAIKEAIKNLRREQEEKRNHKTIVSLYREAEKTELAPKVSKITGYGDFHTEVGELLTHGLWRPSQRYDATCKLSYFAVQQGWNKDQAVSWFVGWLDNHHNGLSKDYIKNPNTCFKEFEQLFKKAKKDSKKYLKENSRIEVPLSVCRVLYRKAKETDATAQYGRLSKVFRALVKLYIVAMVHGVKPYMAKGYLEAIGLKYQSKKRWSVIACLIENGLIQRIYEEVPANNLTGRVRRWYLPFMFKIKSETTNSKSLSRSIQVIGKWSKVKPIIEPIKEKPKETLKKTDINRYDSVYSYLKDSLPRRTIE